MQLILHSYNRRSETALLYFRKKKNRSLTTAVSEFYFVWSFGVFLRISAILSSASFAVRARENVKIKPNISTATMTRAITSVFILNVLSVMVMRF